MVFSAFSISSAAALLALALQASAAPFAAEPVAMAEPIFARANHNISKQIVSDFPVHSSCNASQKMQIERGLFDLKRANRAAIDHLLLYGNSSDIFITYFGEKGDPAVPLGIYERILNGDKSKTLFRCDDPDRNCATQDGWNGHWRGSNASEETVICDLSYQTRLPIEKICSHGFQLASDNLNVYWGLDLLHRAMHLPSVTNDYVTHVADEYAEALELAKEKPDSAVKNQRTLQYFAFEAFARRYIDPQGCVGEIEDDHAGHSHGHAGASSPSTSSQASTPSATIAASSAVPSAPAGQAAPPAAGPGQDCHSHSDGTVHCS